MRTAFPSLLRLEGGTWLSLGAVAECYDCEVDWLDEARRHGLLGRALHRGGEWLVHVVVLDRVAELVRLSRIEGMAFETIVVLLARQPADACLAAVRIGEGS